MIRHNPLLDILEAKSPRSPARRFPDDVFTRVIRSISVDIPLRGDCFGEHSGEQSGQGQIEEPMPFDPEGDYWAKYRRPWKGREYDLASRTTQTFTRVDVPDSNPHLAVRGNTMRRAITFIGGSPLGTGLTVSPYFGWLPFVGGWDVAGSGPYVQHVLNITDRDYGGLVYLPWYYVGGGGGQYFGVIEDIYLPE